MASPELARAAADEVDGAGTAHPGAAHPGAAAWLPTGPGTGEGRHMWLRLALLVAAAAIGAYVFGAYIAIVIAALLVSVILHELGHFWTAKRTGMKATEFFVGFGPPLWSFRRGETTFGLKPILAGAYVRIIGMSNLDEVDPDDEPRTYRAQSTPKRMAVVLAGPGMNIAIAFVLLFAVFVFSGKLDESRWTVERVGADTAAARAGVQPGDRVLSIDGAAVGTFEQFRDQLDARAGEQVTLAVERGGETVALRPTLGWRLTPGAAALVPATPPLERSDVVVSVDGAPVPTYGDFRERLSRGGAPATLVIERGRHHYELVVGTPVALPAEGSSGYLGVRPDIEVVRETPVGAVGETVRTFGGVTAAMATGIGKLFSPSGLSSYANQVGDAATGRPDRTEDPSVLTPLGDSPPADLVSRDVQERPTSVVGIGQVLSLALEDGVWDFLTLLALVNIALALINLVPLLPFDGGHAAIAAYEGVRGRIRGAPYRVDITKMMPVAYGVFAVLALLGATSIFLDIVRPVAISP